MLLEIHCDKFIESNHIRPAVKFHKGLNVLSGETGAGKSIIIDAVALVLGGRADRDLIRTGCDRASVEAEFTAEDADGLQALARLIEEKIRWD